MNLRADTISEGSFQELIKASFDITGAVAVQVQIRDDKSVVWVNVNGVCVLRICQIQELQVIST